jgi:Cu/Ag efflux protein CusF
MSISSSISTLLVCSVPLVAPIAAAHAQTAGATFRDAVVSTAPVPPTVYVSVFDAYRADPRDNLWPWTRLFAADGTLVDRATRDAAAVEVTVRKPVGGHEEHGGGRTVKVAPAAATQAADVHAGHHQPTTTPPETPSVDEPVPAGADLVGVVQAIDRGASSLELKHGPIAKLGMGAMTMFFRVRDTAFLDQVTVGQRFAFTLEMTDRGVVISGVQKVPEQ